MLSKIAILVLGLIAEKPMNPYEIQKIIENAHMKKIYSMSSSSIYATINVLKRKGYIIGKKVKEGNMPEKTIYSATSIGEEAFRETLAYNMSELENLFSEFDVSIVFLCHLSKKEALNSLYEHREKTEKMIEKSENRYERFENTGLPYTALVRRKHHIYKRKAELKSINDLIKYIEEDDDWNHYPALEWTNWVKDIK